MPIYHVTVSVTRYYEVDVVDAPDKEAAKAFAAEQIYDNDDFQTDVESETTAEEVDSAGDPIKFEED